MVFLFRLYYKAEKLYVCIPSYTCACTHFEVLFLIAAHISSIYSEFKRVFQDTKNWKK